MYISEITEKPILSLYEGELLGNIHKIYFDKTRKKIKAFEIINEQEITYLLSPKHIYTLGKNAITVKNKQNLSLIRYFYNKNTKTDRHLRKNAVSVCKLFSGIVCKTRHILKFKKVVFM